MILITGAARSGTSLIAGIIDICGGFGGEMFGPSKYNRKGMYENTYIRERIIKAYISEMNVDARCQYPLPDISKVAIVPDFNKKIEDIFYRQGWDGTQALFYKCPKISHIWKLWKHAFPCAKWVIVRRRTEDIVNSCIRTGFMNAFDNKNIQKEINVKSTKQGWTWWVNEHQKRFLEIKNSDCNSIEIWPEKMVEGNYTEIENLINWLGLEWKEEEVKKFIEPKLFSHKKKGK
ncbi:MAG: hypothetical protein B6I31_05520 [Desulfobacteraceae bacterium 4572_19]|nr:MAG: hypothetical protein B6I31_05520 [Desulfobacteraceae bacterium 4572_19]